MKRIKYGEETRFDDKSDWPEKCHDCDVKLGKLHLHGCDMEECAECGNQKITCDCPCEKGEKKYRELLEEKKKHIAPMSMKALRELSDVWDKKKYYCDKCGENITKLPTIFHEMEFCEKCYKKCITKIDDMIENGEINEKQI